MKQLLVILSMFTISFAHAQSKNFIDQPYIEVTGSADSSVTPNEIFVKIILSEKDTRDRVSLEDMEKKMVEVIRSLGINPEKDLVTNDMASNYKTYLFKSKDVLKVKQYTLKVVDAITVTKLMQQLEAIDISNVSVDRVGRSDIEQIKNAMRGKAIENAKARAHALTAPLNQSFGMAINISDLENYGSNYYLQGVAAGVRIRGTSSLSGPVEPTRIEFEKLRLSVNVNVKFVLK
jgi:uncharacterized protein YggE